MLKRHLIQQVYFLKAFLPNPSGHDIAETLLAPRYIQRVAKNPLLEVISLHGSTGPLPIKEPQRWQGQSRSIRNGMFFINSKNRIRRKRFQFIAVKNYEIEREKSIKVQG